MLSYNNKSFQKIQNASLYIHWLPFDALQWKHSTFKALVYYGFKICSNDNEKQLHSQLNYLQKFTWFITRVFEKA